VTENAPTSTVFVARQQIYDRELNVAAYELLFRSGVENHAAVSDGDVATSQLMINAVIEIGLENLVFGRPAYVNFTKNFLLGKYEIPFEPDKLVIEVLEDVEPEPEIIAALVTLRETGYAIAIDHYVESDKRKELLNLADILKIDLKGFSKDVLVQEVKELKQRPLKLLAEKVETVEEFNHCKELGFDYFQGFFLSRPQVVKGQTIANNQLAILNLLVQLRDPNVTFKEVVDLVKQDVALSVKLLKYVNSVVFGVRREIESIHQAAVRLGLKKICEIATLISMGGLAGAPLPLIETTLIRARMCEILGARNRRENTEVCFTVGLFSSMDAFLGQSLSLILKELPLTIEIKEALLSHAGPMGRLLSSVIAFERGNWDSVSHPEVPETAIQSAYLNAVSWANSQASVVSTAT